MKKGGKNEEEPSFENEFKKLKLKAEYGAKFNEENGQKLSSEVESQWLDYIMAFEDASQRQKD